MIIPQEFQKLAARFYQGSDSEFATPQEWVASAVRDLDAEERQVVKRFLTTLLSGDYKGAELQQVWDSTRADYYFGNDEREMRVFFALLRDAMDQDASE